VRSQDGPVSLQVDEVGDVVDLDTAGFELPPGNVEPAIRHLLRGVYQLKDRLLLVLDTARATEIAPPVIGTANNVTANIGTAKRNHDDTKTE
jgi:purine-binding chemotaxis protein CheW